MHQSYPPLIERREASTRGINVVIVCEHASNAIPTEFADLHLDAATLQSHVAWDPGALGVARELRRLLFADLVAGSVSRLLYDCNRPPDAISAMPAVSELYEIPGNRNLSAADRAARVAAIYVPFRTALAQILDERGTGVVVTVHSFTPIYFGTRRTSEIGILHDTDTRLADAILSTLPQNFPFKVACNVPYSASDGVTHTLKEHAIGRAWPNVMLEIRSDLIETPARQATIAAYIADLLSGAISHLKALGNV